MQKQTAYLKNILKSRLTYMLIIQAIVILATFQYIDIWSVLTIPAQFMGIICVYQIANKSKRNFVMGIISSFIFVVNAYLHGLNADMVMQIGFIVFDFVGLYTWKKSTKLRDLNKLELLATFIITGLLVLLFKQTISNSYIDALTGAVGWLAMYFTARAYKNSFYVWTPLNLLQALLWFYAYYSTGGQAPISLGIMYLVYFYNSVFGFITWYKEKRNIKPEVQ